MPLIKNSFLIVFGTALFSSIFGLGCSILTNLTNISFKKILNICFILPIALPLYVLAFLYVGLLEYSGILHTTLRSFDIDIYHYFSIKSWYGVSFVFSLGLFPYIYLTTNNAFKQLGAEQIKSALSLGKSRLEVLRFVLFPAIRSAFFAGLTLLALEVLSDFGGVSIFNYDTFTTSIYNAWSGLYSYGTAARLSLVLILFSFSFLYFESKFKCHNSSDNGNTKKVMTLFQLSKRTKILSYLFCLILIFFSLILPTFTLLFWSLEALSTELNKDYFTLIKNTFFLGLVASVSLYFVGLFLSLIKRRQVSKWHNKVITLCLLGYGIPGNVIAVAIFSLFIIFANFFDIQMGTFLSLLCLITGYLIRFISVGYRNILAPLNLIPLEIDKAARTLGKSRFSLLKEIHFPLLRPSIFPVFILLFIEIIKEMPLTLMIRPTGFNTLAVKIFELTSEGEWERAALPSLFLVVIAFSATIVTKFRTKDKNETFEFLRKY
ncbi:MAG: ABC transporter permease [Bacteriovoracaceae bacterium]